MTKFKSLLLVLMLTGCSSLQVFENQKNQAAATQATSDAGQQLLLLKNQLELQKKVLRTTKQAKAQARVTESEKQIKALESRFQSLRETTGAYSAYAHAHPRVLSNEPGWAQAEQWRSRLQSETKAFNELLQIATQAINAGNQVFTELGLYKKKSSQELAATLQSDTESWRGTYNQLAGRFMQAQQGAPSEEALLHLQTMQKNMKELEGMIARIDRLKSQFQSLFGGRGEITNLDPDWPELEKMANQRQQLRTDWESAIGRAEQSYDRFNRALAGSETNP